MQPTSEPPAPDESAELSKRLFFTAIAGLSLAVALVVFSVSYLPTSDGPQHVLSGFLQKTFSEPGTPYRDLLEPLPEFAERGFSIVFVPMLELLAWRTALNATLTLMVLSGAWAFAGLACALAKRRTPWALLGFALAFPWTLYMGFLPFVLAANVGLAIVAFAIGREEPRRVHLFMLAAMLLAEAVMHVGAAAFTGLVLVLVFLFRAPAGHRVRAVATIALVGAPAAAILAGVLLSPSSLKEGGDLWVWAPRSEWILELPRYIVPGPMPRGLVGCGLVGCGLVAGIRRLMRGEASRAELAVLTAATLFIACAALGPIHVPAWQLVAPRFASLGVPLAVALLAPLWPSRSPRLGLVAISGLTGISLAITCDLHRRLSRGCEPALAGLASNVQLTGFTLPLPLDSVCGVSPDPVVSEIPYLTPLFHVGALYAVARGGFTPYMFSGSSAVHAFRYREDAVRNGGPPRPSPQLYLALVGDDGRKDPTKREYLVARFAEHGTMYDHLLVVGAREGELASIMARGYVADWQTDSAMIAHPRSCTFDVLIETDDPRGVLVEIGQRPAGPVVVSLAAVHGEVLANGVHRLRSSAAGCGPVWVRGFLDVDGSGAASKKDVFCAGAGPDGRLNVTIVDRAEVLCHVDRVKARPTLP